MTPETVTAYLGLGSNMADREAELAQALRAIDRFPGTSVIRVSPIYRSEPWGLVQQPDFLNLVAEITTNRDPQALLALCKQTEKEQGREVGVRWGPRPIDLDVLLYGNLHIESPTLQIPHPRMWERAFVLRPLADLRPDLHDPAGGPIISLLERPEIKSQKVWPYSREAEEPGNEN